MWNTTVVSERMRDQADLVNKAFEYRTPVEVKIENRYPDANFAIFDVWSLVRLSDHESQSQIATPKFLAFSS